LLLSHPRYHTKNIEEMINILINNGYTLGLIFSTIKNRIHHMSSIDIKERFNFINDSKEQLFFTVPYVKGDSEKLKKITVGIEG